MSITSVTRRGFLYGCFVLSGGLAFGVHWTGRAMAGVQTLMSHMCERIASVYREDQAFAHRASQDNAQVKLLYKNYLDKPLSETAEHLLHSHWYDKSAAVKKLHEEGQYPGPRGGAFLNKKYPYEA
ncbi:iron hydrogenase small subunit [uncultured Mailhella sp.]|uniref:iron hydrogenase small subunit n=1 Tax=uncultured Mailhella sp. TaxID=1981031 RepID=UPI00263198A6|nr:iron hydrogenase small subunit [uncultured Mailhella sp.]